MTEIADHIDWAAEAVAVFQVHCRTGDEHAIADLICDLGHLAEERGLDFLSEVRRGIGHWYAEHHAVTAINLGLMPPLRSSSSQDNQSRSLAIAFFRHGRKKPGAHSEWAQPGQ
jgi:hypothetical protein